MARRFRSLKLPVKPGEGRKVRKSSGDGKQGKVLNEIEKKGEEALENLEIASDIHGNLDRMREIFKDCSDIVFRGFTIGEKKVECLLVYIEEIVSSNGVNESILRALVNSIKVADSEELADENGLIDIMKERSVAAGKVKFVYSMKEVVKEILIANCVLFIDGNEKALAIGTTGWEARNVSEPVIEMVVRGPMEGFTENLNTNAALLRKRIKTSDFKMVRFELGKVSKLSVYLSYIKGIANEGIVKEAKKRLGRIDIDAIQDSSTIEQLIEDSTFSPFPQVESSERPDSSAAAIAEGRIVLLVDGSPFALIVPAVFVNFLSSPEDYYHRVYFSTVIRFLRYISLTIALLAPSFYIAITTFHPEMIPTTLLISITTARAQVPFPAVVEAFLMELTFEILREAGVRLPRPVGQSINIVGALVIGEIAVQAGFVSQIMVIVVAFTGIASFTVPKFTTGIAIRLLRFPMMALAASFGAFGIIMGILFLMIHTASLRSFGIPYLSPMAPAALEDMKDTVFRAPVWALKKRPSYIEPEDPDRMGEDLRPEPPG